MPTIEYQGRSIECPPGANLRMVLLRARLPLYTKVAHALHCRGNGVCGTCAVEIQGETSAPTDAERRRLRLSSHAPSEGLRLACQVSVRGDLQVTKHGGLFARRAEKGG